MNINKLQRRKEKRIVKKVNDCFNIALTIGKKNGAKI